MPPSKKHCHGCGRDLPVDAFSRSTRERGGRQTRCKACVSTSMKRYYSKNRAAKIAASSEHYYRTHLYQRWYRMLQRCENPSHYAFANYGGRGIAVCERWHTFEFFRADVEALCSPELQMDRIDNDGDYEPGNVRFVPSVVNNRNRRNTVRITAFGETRTIVEWADRAGQKPSTIYMRIRRGWPVERAIGGA